MCTCPRLGSVHGNDVRKQRISSLHATGSRSRDGDLTQEIGVKGDGVRRARNPGQPVVEGELDGSNTCCYGPVGVPLCRTDQLPAASCPGSLLDIFRRHRRDSVPLNILEFDAGIEKLVGEDQDFELNVVTLDICCGICLGVAEFLCLADGRVVVQGRLPSAPARSCWCR